MGWAVTAAPRPLYPLERPGTHCTGGWVGPRAGVDGCGKSRSPTGIRSPDRPARGESLYRMSYRGPHITPIHGILSVLYKQFTYTQNTKERYSLLQCYLGKCFLQKFTLHHYRNKGEIPLKFIVSISLFYLQSQPLPISGKRVPSAIVCRVAQRQLCDRRNT